jgi:hypothetical protein
MRGSLQFLRPSRKKGEFGQKSDPTKSCPAAAVAALAGQLPGSAEPDFAFLADFLEHG